LVGVALPEAAAQTGVYHQSYPCLAGSGPEAPLAQLAGELMKQAVTVGIAACLRQPAGSHIVG
jgi:hypothetical protein